MTVTRSTLATASALPQPLAALRINGDRLHQRIAELSEIGAIEGGGVCRLALSAEDKAGRDQVVAWMRDLGLQITVDQIGNVVAVRSGLEAGPPVMTGSHIDSVATGGKYDGTLGVLAGLEVMQTLNDHKIVTRRPLAVAFFTNEEGARFHPDMMGSWVFQGGLSLATALQTVGIDGTTVAENLQRIGYAGSEPCGDRPVHAFVELHVEQGPVLEQAGIQIGAVTGVQGMSWIEYTVKGVSNHAGTTPMPLRYDAGFVAMKIATYVRQLALEMGGNQVATVGSMQLLPNLVNVIPKQAVFTVDLRNTNEANLQEAESRLAEQVQAIAAAEGVEIGQRQLVRLQPVSFDPSMVDLVEHTAQRLGCSVQRMPSGAGHDAGMLALMCPTAMIFVPSVNGISHNIREYTLPEDVNRGANILLQTLLMLAT